jgi:hypothetical protein
MVEEQQGQDRAEYGAYLIRDLAALKTEIVNINKR